MAKPLDPCLTLCRAPLDQTTLPAYSRVAVAVVVPDRYAEELETLRDLLLDCLPGEFRPRLTCKSAVATLVGGQVLVIVLHRQWRVGLGFSPSWVEAVQNLPQRLKAAHCSWGAFNPQTMQYRCLEPGHPPLGILARSVCRTVDAVPVFRDILPSETHRSARHTLLSLPVQCFTAASEPSDMLWVDRIDAMDALCQRLPSSFKDQLTQNRQLAGCEWRDHFARWRFFPNGMAQGAMLTTFKGREGVFFSLFSDSASESMRRWIILLCRYCHASSIQT